MVAKICMVSDYDDDGNDEDQVIVIVMIIYNKKHTKSFLLRIQDILLIDLWLFNTCFAL